MQLPLVAPAPIVAQAAPAFRDVFENRCEYAHFQHYLTGLMVLENKSLANLARCTLDSADKTNLSRFLSEAPWSAQDLNAARVQFMLRETQPWQDRRGTGKLSLDDTLCEHVGSLFEYVDQHYDHCSDSYALGHNLVTSHFVSGAVRLALEWRLYRRYDEWTQWEACVARHLPDQPIPKERAARTKFRKAVLPELLKQDADFAALHESFQTKLDLAGELVAAALEAGVPFNVVLMDGWYLAPELVQQIAKAGKDWVSIVKKNRGVETQSFRLRDAPGQPIQFAGSTVRLDELIPLIPRQAYRQVQVKGQAYWCFTFTARLPSLGKVRLVVSFGHADLSGTAVVLASNRVDWSASQILDTYTWRWPIETFYQDGKQLLGLDSYRMRDAQAIAKHWSLVFLAHGLLHLDSLRSATKRGAKVPGKSIGTVCREQSQVLVEKLILYAHDQLSGGHEPTQVFAHLFAKMQPLREPHRARLALATA